LVEKTEFYIKSTNGRNKLHVEQWRPTDGMRAILQISHGMCEYIDRYDEFATYMARNGILVIGNDHLGHGETAKDMNELGFIPAKRRSKTVVTDMIRVTKDVRAKYPNVPFFMLGHSMGSFLARRYMMTCGKLLDGVILTGTGAQPAAALRAGEAMAETVGILKGDHYRSRLLQGMAFSGYNKRIRPHRTDFDWLSVNSANVDAYVADPYCGFTFTVNGFKMMFDLISFIQDENNIQKIPKTLPILMMYGSDDPVGHYGSDVESIRRSMHSAGVKRIEVKSYPGDRHEILNENDREQVWKDILAYMDRIISKTAAR